MAETARASGCGKPGAPGGPRRRRPARRARGSRRRSTAARRGRRPRIRAPRAPGEQLGERVVGELRLLQAHDVGLPLVQPRQQPRQPLLDRVDVPGRDPHLPHATALSSGRGRATALPWPRRASWRAGSRCRVARRKASARRRAAARSRVRQESSDVRVGATAGTTPKPIRLRRRSQRLSSQWSANGSSLNARHLDPAGRAVEGERLGEDRARLDVRDASAAGERARLERLEQAAAEPEPARRRGDPHPLDLGRRVGVVLDGAAADRLAVQVGDEELPGGRPDLVRQRGGADRGSKPRSERRLSSATYSARQYCASGARGRRA